MQQRDNLMNDSFHDLIPDSRSVVPRSLRLNATFPSVKSVVLHLLMDRNWEFVGDLMVDVISEAVILAMAVATNVYTSH